METRAILSSISLPLAAAVSGSIATAPGTKSAWYRDLDKPAIQPPAAVFPVVWSILYAQTAAASAAAQGQMEPRRAKAYRRKLAVNMALNGAWSWSFFRGRQVGASVFVAGALAASSADLARTAGQASKPAGGLLAPYAAWTAFATVLNAAIWRKNR